MNGRKAAAAVFLAVTAVLWGLCWRLDPHQPETNIEVIPLSSDGPGPVLDPGESAPGGVTFLNRGNMPCQLRVKLCPPRVDGQAVLEAGDLEEGGFRRAGWEDPQAQEYWQAQGEYLYYRNRETGGLLLPGGQTPAAYSAVRVNQRLEAGTMELLRSMGAQRLFIVAQVRVEDGDWITVGG